MKLSTIAATKDFTKSLQIHNTLNRKIWNGHQIKPTIHKKLLQIYNQFIKDNEIDITVHDVVMMGSSCDTNFTNLSDIDLHFVIPFTEASKEYQLMVAKCKLWNGAHNIKIYGHKVEINPQTKTNPFISKDAAIYSIQNNKWKRQPVDHEITTKMRAQINVKCHEYEQQIIAAKKHKSWKELDDIMKSIKDKRKNGVVKDGEMSIDNLVFKCLRNVGLIEKIHDDAFAIKDDEQSL